MDPAFWIRVWAVELSAWNLFGPPRYQHPCSLLHEVDKWDALHGEKELRHHLDTQYNTRGIMFKFLMVGASMGLLPLLLDVYALALGGFRGAIFGYTYLGDPDCSLNRLYCKLINVPVSLLKSEHVGFVGDTALCRGLRSSGVILPDTLEEWRASPLCWYGRKGKLPIFQWNVEDDNSVG